MWFVAVCGRFVVVCGVLWYREHPYTIKLMSFQAVVVLGFYIPPTPMALRSNRDGRTSV